MTPLFFGALRDAASSQRPSVRKRLGFVGCLGAALVATLPGLSACYATGAGTDPPLDRLYFPVGLSVSHGGNVLYALNSDFDLQYNGGTIQSYDLHKLRLEADASANNTAACVAPPVDGTPLGQTCVPPQPAANYIRDSAIVGAFGTDLQSSAPTSALVRPEGVTGAAAPRTKARLFAPIRGSASLLFADVAEDTTAPDGAATKDSYAPFRIQCGQDASNICRNSAGTDTESEPQNTRGLRLPGEPFALAQSEDGSTLVVTHQSDTKTTLLSSGLDYTKGDAFENPSVQFIADGMRVGGVGLVTIPYDPDAFAQGARPRPAYLETTRSVAELSLLRQYDDIGPAGSSTLRRPFLSRERAYPLSIAAGGSDSRGLALDPTPRIACKARVKAADPAAVPPRTDADVQADRAACARKPLRVFLANRSPGSLLVGELGNEVGKSTGAADSDKAYDPERLTFFDPVPLATGPSKVFLAPIVDANGKYALRVFVVCFDASSIFVVNPDTRRLENVIRVEAGPFALAFDPFDLQDVALKADVPVSENIRKYRFAYVASFTKSAVQMIDLDNSRPSKDTFEKVVFTLGEPTLPKGVK